MTDLNAPLGRDRPPRASAPAPKGHFASAVVIAFLIAVGIGNAAIVLTGDRATQTALLTLPEPAGLAPDPAITTGTVQPAARDPNGSGVEIVYGDVERAPLNPPVGLPDEDGDGRLVSPGGPKIITVRDPASIALGQPIDVAHLPEDAALEDTEFGPLPVRADDGRRPMDIYARPWSGARGKRIALVIGGLGLSQTGTQRAIEALPPEITLAFAPTGNSLNRWMREARRQGHELLVQVPMEPFGYPQIDPGPNTLRLASSAETNLENLHWAMGRITNYTGIMNYMGGRFVTDDAAMAPVLGDLAYRGLLFFNDGSAGGERLGQIAASRGVPYLAADMVIDGSQDSAFILERLEALEELAAARGYAVGSGSALELTVSTVAQWANEAKKRGFEIVGVAALASQ